MLGGGREADDPEPPPFAVTLWLFRAEPPTSEASPRLRET
jgi:hypothetical protein